MKVAFLEAEGFARVREEHFDGDDDFREFQNFLINNPRAGDVVPGLGSVRKVRWGSIKRGKGKRGGLRILYVYVEQVAAILLIKIYGKNEADDLTFEEKKRIALMARTFREEITARWEHKE